MRLPEEGRPAGFSRRQFLRGAGVCVALPLFESLGGNRLLAAATSAGAAPATTATGAPLRTAFVYFPNGSIPSAWWPTGDGADDLGLPFGALSLFRQRAASAGGAGDRTVCNRRTFVLPCGVAVAFTVRDTAQGAQFALRVQPRASRNAIAGVVGDAVKLAITAPPVDGKANGELRRFLSDAFAVPFRCVTLLHGQSARRKVVRIEAPAKRPDLQWE